MAVKAPTLVAAIEASLNLTVLKMNTLPRKKAAPETKDKTKWKNHHRPKNYGWQICNKWHKNSWITHSKRKFYKYPRSYFLLIKSS